MSENGERERGQGTKGKRQGAGNLLTRVIFLLASLKLAIIVLAILAVVLATATVLESRYGTPFVQWYIYHSNWFVGLLALLGLNVFCATARRWPWKWHQLGFVATHAGLLVATGRSDLVLCRWS